jgi:hypothetical protein
MPCSKSQHIDVENASAIGIDRHQHPSLTPSESKPKFRERQGIRIR